MQIVISFRLTVELDLLYVSFIIAAKTDMIVAETSRDFPSLRDRCRGEILRYVKDKSDLEKLELPATMTQYLADAYCDERPLTPVDNVDKYKV